jgi:hypothetical protein
MKERARTRLSLFWRLRAEFFIALLSSPAKIAACSSKFISHASPECVVLESYKLASSRMSIKPQSCNDNFGGKIEEMP